MYGHWEVPAQRRLAAYTKDACRTIYQRRQKALAGEHHTVAAFMNVVLCGEGRLDSKKCLCASPLSAHSIAEQALCPPCGTVSHKLAAPLSCPLRANTRQLAATRLLHHCAQIADRLMRNSHLHLQPRLVPCAHANDQRCRIWRRHRCCAALPQGHSRAAVCIMCTSKIQQIARNTQRKHDL